MYLLHAIELHSNKKAFRITAVWWKCVCKLGMMPSKKWQVWRYDAWLDCKAQLKLHHWVCRWYHSSGTHQQQLQDVIQSGGGAVSGLVSVQQSLTTAPPWLSGRDSVHLSMNMSDDTKKISDLTRARLFHWACASLSATETRDREILQQNVKTAENIMGVSLYLQHKTSITNTTSVKPLD